MSFNYCFEIMHVLEIIAAFHCISYILTNTDLYDHKLHMHVYTRRWVLGKTLLYRHRGHERDRVTLFGSDK